MMSLQFDPHIIAILADMDIRRRPPAGSLAELERDFPEWARMSARLSNNSSKSLTEPITPAARMEANDGPLERRHGSRA